MVISAFWWYKCILPTKPPPQSTYADGLREGRRCKARADVALHSGEKHFRWWHFAAATLVSTFLVGVVTGEIEVYRPQVTLEDDASLMQVRVENQLAQPLTLRLAASSSLLKSSDAPVVMFVATNCSASHLCPTSTSSTFSTNEKDFTLPNTSAGLVSVPLSCSYSGLCYLADVQVQNLDEICPVYKVRMIRAPPRPPKRNTCKSWQLLQQIIQTEIKWSGCGTYSYCHPMRILCKLGELQVVALVDTGSDYDAINVNFPITEPHDKIQLFDEDCPFLASGTPKQFENLCKAFVEVSNQRIEILKQQANHYHDQEFFQYNFMPHLNDSAEDLRNKHNILMTRDRSEFGGFYDQEEGEVRTNHYETFQLIKNLLGI